MANSKIFKTRIKQRRDTSANWESKNPVLLNGEVIIVDTASGETRTKTGDGEKTYTQLPFDDEGTKGGKSLIDKSFADNVSTSGNTTTIDKQLKTYSVTTRLEADVVITGLDENGQEVTKHKLSEKADSADVYTKSEINEVLKNNRPSKSVPIDPSIVSELMNCGVSYLNHKDSFSFTDSGKGTFFDDDFSTESPKIDCSSLGMALVMGIPYEYSKYVGKNNSKHYEYGIKLPTNPYSTDRPNRYYTHELAHYFDEQGWCFIPDKNYSDIAPGDIIFVSFKNRDGNSDFHDNAYMKIDHCLFVLGYKDDTHLICLHTSEQYTIHFYDVCVASSEYDSTSTNNYNDSIKLVARLPFKPGNITEKPIFVDSTAKTTTSTTNGLLTTINLDRPLKKNTTYTLIANVKNAFTQVKPSVNNYFGIRASYADGTADETIFSWAKNVYPEDDLYRCHFVTANKEITTLKLYILTCTVAGHQYEWSALYEGAVSTTPYESDLSRNQSDIVVIDNLESTSTMNSLSANQGRILNENKVDKVEGKSLVDENFANGITVDASDYESTGRLDNLKIGFAGLSVHSGDIEGSSITVIGDVIGNMGKDKLSEKADSIKFERLQYYGDSDIEPSPESYFTVNADGDTITGLTHDGKTAITNGTTEIVIPYEINGNKIIAIAADSFVYLNFISVIIPNTIASLHMHAFANCTSLTCINIPDSVSTIEDATFAGCSSLTSINIPEGVITIEDETFASCSSLTSINIPNNVTTIGSLAFEGCTSLTIYCEQGSYAETYAKENSIPVVYTDMKSTALDNKVDKVTGKSLIDENVADNLSSDAERVYLKKGANFKTNGDSATNGVWIYDESIQVVGSSGSKYINITATDVITSELGKVTHKLSEKAEAKTYTVSVPTTSWTEKTDTDSQKYYYKKITVSGMTASGQAMTDVAMSDSVATARKEMEAYQCVNRVVTGDGYVELYCFEEAPTTAFTLRVLVISNVLS